MTTAKNERKSKAASRRKSPAKRPDATRQQATQQRQQAPDTSRDANGLTAQQALFVRAYLVHGNASKAAVEAGYSPATARSQGSRLLSHVDVEAAITQAKADESRAAESKITALKAELDITSERTLREWSRLAFCDIRRLYRPDGNLIPLHELDDDIAAALVGVDVQELYGGSGEDRQVIGVVKKYKLLDKTKALDALSRHQNLYKADNDSKSDALAAVLGIAVRFVEPKHAG